MTALPPSAPRPDGEELRQAALFASGVLSMRGNARLRSIVDRVAVLFDVPLAAVSIIDRDRQWFPAIHGADDLEETTRDVAFCAHTILTPESMNLVCDATKDPRFAANPMVVDDPRIRFYLGAPLVTAEGAAIGALCAVGMEVRDTVTPEQQAELRALADEAMAEIERLEHVRSGSPEAIEAIVEQIRLAAEAEDEDLLNALDRVLQRVEGIVRAA